MRKRSRFKLNGEIIRIIVTWFFITISIIGCVVLIGIYQNNDIKKYDMGTNIEEITKLNCFGNDISSWFSCKYDIDINKPGIYDVEYDLLFFKIFTRKVEIKDGIAPEMKLFGETKIELYNIDDYEEEGYSAVDESDGDLTYKVKHKIKRVKNNLYRVIYSVADSSGNKVTKSRKISILQSKGNVFLTFDDGPSTEVTPQILDILEREKVKATFFILGFDIGSEVEKILKEEYAKGHTIGLHGKSHEYSEIYSSLDSIMNNFYSLEYKVILSLNINPVFIRFPGGASNTVSQNYCEGIMSEATKKVTDEGFVYVDWNVDSNDAGSSCNNADEIYNNVISGLVPGRDNIVLMHDTNLKTATVVALPKIIKYCKKNGYVLKAIDSDTEKVQHAVVN